MSLNLRESARPLLDQGVETGIITPDQRDRLLTLAATWEGDDAHTSRSPNVVLVAYGLGSLLVLFASGWFLVERWARLGPFGVAGVALGYAAALLLAAREFLRRGFRLAADISTMLAVSLTPLVAWAALALAGRWPYENVRDPLLRDVPYMAWQWLVLDLSTLLVALLAWRHRRMVALCWPLALALWGTWFHIGQVMLGQGGSLEFERWLMLANGFALLVVAERVERWQGAAMPVTPATMSGQGARGDFANVFWMVGLLATTFAFLMLWLRADDPWRHLLLPLALGLVALSLYLGRRVVLGFGVMGVIGYLAFLAQDVFRDVVSFPILLAGFGVLLIFVTVWTQSRFPAIVARVGERVSADGTLPWSRSMAYLPVIVALAMAAATWREGEEERTQREFRERYEILRLHSGSIPGDRGRPRVPRPVPAPGVAQHH